MNECDIAETCTGDSSQVRPALPPYGIPGEAIPIPIPMVLAQLGDNYSPCPPLCCWRPRR